MAATATLYYERLLPSPIDDFEKFQLHLRLERNNENIGRGMVCHWKEVINKGLGDIKEPAATCRTGWHRRSGKSGWTADGVVIYNINNDGSGDHFWALIGSPSL